jgi:serine/threonine-protein kinase
MHVIHPNVVEVLSVNARAEAPYVVMEALVGESLGALLTRVQRLDSGRAVELVREAAAGLAALHLAGLVHRDVKPDNLFLAGSADGPRALKVLDFGHVHMAPEADQVPEEADTVLGTAQYMAPEQVVGDPVDARTDVYALGVVMFRMFTGHLPFDLDLGVDLLRHQLASPAPPPSWLNDEIDPLLEAVILKAMRKHPRNRHQSMAELISELDAACAPRRSAPGPRGSNTPDLYAPQSPRAVKAVSMLIRASA